MRKNLALAVLLSLLAAALAAQQVVQIPPHRTVAQLGTCTTASPKIVAVTDGTGATDVTVGGGSTQLLAACLNGTWAAIAGSGGAGTVTSVGASGPSGIATWSSAVTGSGTLTQTLSTQTANKVLASGTSGGAATPAFRALVAADIPTLNQNTSGSAASLSATLGVATGGTGATSLAAHGVVIGNGTGAVNVTGAGTSGQVLTSNGASADPTFQTAAGGSPGGSSGGIQYNNSGAFGGSATTINSGGDITVATDKNITLQGAGGISGRFATIGYPIGDWRWLRDASDYGGPYNYYALHGVSSPNGGSGGNYSSIWKGSHCYTASSNADNGIDLCTSRHAAGGMSIDSTYTTVGDDGDGNGYLIAHYGVQIGTATSRPTCDSSLRGRQWIVQGGSGVADTIAVCCHNVSNAYVWSTAILSSGTCS